MCPGVPWTRAVGLSSALWSVATVRAMLVVASAVVGLKIISFLMCF